MSTIIDAHHHLWDYNKAEYGWIGDDMAAIRRDFRPDLLAETLSEVGVDGSVVVQARQTLQETDRLLAVATDNSVIRGVVGWFPLAEPAVEEAISRRLEGPGGSFLAGVRHVVQDEPDPDFILGSAFNRGVELLKEFNLVYDILVTERQLPQVLDFVDRHRNHQFVLDHIAKPRIAEGVLEPWKRNITELAKRENVTCKISGLVTEADWDHWTLESLRPYLDHVVASFGPRQLMFGSDWPVCLVAASYGKWFRTIREYCAAMTADEQKWLMGQCAVETYGLSDR